MKKILIFSMMLVLFGSDALAFDLAKALKKKRDQGVQQAEVPHLARYGEVQVHNNGTVTIHGKQWMRCSLGQRWTGSTCTGTAVEANWYEVQVMAKLMNQTVGFAGFRDWRVPTIVELEQLRLCSTGKTNGQFDIPGKEVSVTINVFAGCGGDFLYPTIDTTLFPNTPDAWFWSSSKFWLSSSPPSHAWFVDFFSGLVFGDSMSNNNMVRLVRTGQALLEQYGRGTSRSPVKFALDSDFRDSTFRKPGTHPIFSDGRHLAGRAGYYDVPHTIPHGSPGSLSLGAGRLDNQ